MGLLALFLDISGKPPDISAAEKPLYKFRKTAEMQDKSATKKTVREHLKRKEKKYG